MLFLRGCPKQQPPLATTTALPPSWQVGVRDRVRLAVLQPAASDRGRRVPLPNLQRGEPAERRGHSTTESEEPHARLERLRGPDQPCGADAEARRIGNHELPGFEASLDEPALDLVDDFGRAGIPGPQDAGIRRA